MGEGRSISYARNQAMHIFGDRSSKTQDQTVVFSTFNSPIQFGHGNSICMLPDREVLMHAKPPMAIVFAASFHRQINIVYI